jgi:hypothetical protein
VFRRLVPASAFESFEGSDQLETGVGLTLFEKEQAPGQVPVYWVAPVIRDTAWEKLDHDEQSRLHQQTYQWYGNYWWNLLLCRESLQLQQEVTDRIDENIVQQAIEGKDGNVAVLLNDLGLRYWELGHAKHGDRVL